MGGGRWVWGLWEETGQESGSGSDVLRLPRSQPGGVRWEVRQNMSVGFSSYPPGGRRTLH